MKMMKTLLAGMIASSLVASPVLADDTPAAGGGMGGAETWATMPIGSYVMIGGFVFIVIAGGIRLVDDNDKTSPTPPPTPAPPPATTTTSST